MKDRDKTREQLIAENEELRRCLGALMNNLPEGVVIVDPPDAKVRLVSRYGREMIGVSWDEIEGIHGDEHFRYYQFCHADGTPAKVEQLPLARALGSGEVIRNEEWLLQLPDGTGIPVLCHGGPVRDQHGTITGAVLSWQDITDRKRAEESLRKAHDELDRKVKDRTAELIIFQRFAEASGRGFGMTHLDGRIKYVNPTLCRLFGEEKPEDLIDKHVSAYCTQESMHRMEREILPAVLRGESWNGEQLVLSRSGTPTPTFQTAFLIRDENGEPFRLGVAVADISGLKQAEAAVRRSEARLRLAQHVARSGTFEENIRTGEVLWTPELEALYGLAPGEFPGTLAAWENLVHQDDRAAVTGLAAKALESGEPVDGEWRVVWPDGTVRWLAGRWQLLHDDSGKPLRVIGVNVDITKRKHAEEALRQSERRFRNYFEQGLIGMAATSPDKRWLAVNDRTCEMLGYSREELSRKTWAELTHPDDLDKDVEQFQRLLDREIENYTLTKRFIRKDGSEVCTTIHIRAFRKEDGSVDHVVALIEDISERKRVQEALERERQSLWRMLQASDRERQTISYEIHDGLAQYLAAAAMQFQVFEQLRESDPEEAKKAYDAAIQLISQSHAEARRLISEVRPPVIDEIGLETAISHLVHEERRHGEPQIELCSNVRFGRLASILENALYRIAQEALGNACKHSHSKRVVVSLGQEGQEVRLEVRDWGDGFDPRSVGEGHFGLEGIRQRVRLLGGRLKIESTPGSGTLVQVVVPILEQRPAPRI